MFASSAGGDDTLLVRVAEASQVAEVRRRAASLAERLGFDAAGTGKVAIVATEAATNLVRHAGGGLMLVTPAAEDGGAGLRLVALDQGPGLGSAVEAIRDGFSTAGSAGIGLGGMRRLSDVFEVYSRPGEGAAVLATFWPAHRRPAPCAGRVCAVSVPLSGEDVCGDAWAVEERAGRTTVLLADGLGHGAEAAEAARAAVRVFRATPTQGPGALVAAMHGALRPTRGAAVGIAEIEPARQRLRFAGVGNIAGVIVAPGGTRHLVSQTGIVGHAVRRIDEVTYPWEAGALLVAHSDGLAGRWELAAYPGLAARHPCLIAGVLLRDFRRTRDDVTVVVVQGRAA